MNKLTLLIMLVAVLYGERALATGWAPIMMEENMVREVDTASVARKGPLVTFTARHTFVDLSEYEVERHEAKYLLFHNRANCDSRTLAQLDTEAYDEKMMLISKHQIQQPQDFPVTEGSIDEAVLNFICKVGK